MYSVVGEAFAQMTRFVPTEQILRDAAALRETLAARWLSAAQASAALEPEFGRDGQRASELRRQGKLLGVYVTHTLCYRYPTWQFLPDGRPAEHLPEILTVLRNSCSFQCEPNGLRRSTGWGEAEWFLSPHALLSGAAPAAMLSIDSALVLYATQCEFEEIL